MALHIKTLRGNYLADTSGTSWEEINLDFPNFPHPHFRIPVVLIAKKKKKMLVSQYEYAFSGQLGSKMFPYLQMGAKILSNPTTLSKPAQIQSLKLFFLPPFLSSFLLLFLPSFLPQSLPFFLSFFWPYLQPIEFPGTGIEPTQ